MFSLLNLMHHKYSVERRLCWAHTYILNRLWIVHMLRWPLFTPQMSGSLCCLFLGRKPNPAAWIRLLNRTKNFRKMPGTSVSSGNAKQTFCSHSVERKRRFIYLGLIPRWKNALRPEMSFYFYLLFTILQKTNKDKTKIIRVCFTRKVEKLFKFFSFFFTFSNTC